MITFHQDVISLSSVSIWTLDEINASFRFPFSLSKLIDRSSKIQPLFSATAAFGLSLSLSILRDRKENLNLQLTYLYTLSLSPILKRGDQQIESCLCCSQSVWDSLSLRISINRDYSCISVYSKNSPIFVIMICLMRQGSLFLSLSLSLNKYNALYKESNL